LRVVTENVHVVPSYKCHMKSWIETLLIIKAVGKHIVPILQSPAPVSLLIVYLPYVQQKTIQKAPDWTDNCTLLLYSRMQKKTSRFLICSLCLSDLSSSQLFEFNNYQMEGPPNQSHSYYMCNLHIQNTGCPPPQKTPKGLK
jgi:hypothetical protein